MNFFRSEPSSELLSVKRNKENVRSNVANALQILTAIKPYEQSPNQVITDLLAAEARLLNAMKTIEGR